MNPVRVLLVDDQALVRDALRALLSSTPAVEVVGEAADGLEGVRLAASLRPQVTLMDLRMPRLGGVDATRRIRALDANLRVLVLTTFDEDTDVFEALRAGASGYLLKDAGRERLIEALHTVARGESFLQPSIAAKVVTEFARLTRPGRGWESLPERLSERELDVLRQLALGRSNKEIAAALDLVEGTVKNHMSSILGKLGVLDRTQAALKARDLGLL